MFLNSQVIPNFFNIYLYNKILMPAVHSCQGSPRQGKSESVDGNTRLALDPLV